MFISTWMGYAHAAATAALLAVSFSVAIFYHRWLMPAVIMILLLIHPAWMTSAYHGDCGTTRNQLCWLFTSATIATLTWQGLAGRNIRPAFVLRFTIRDLLWLTIVVALAAAWWLDHCRLVDHAARLKIDAQMQRAVDGIE